MNNSFYPHINDADFTFVTKKLREFCFEKGFLEVHTQNRLSILAACEDPHNISTFYYDNNIWPLPQTGQMHLEGSLLKNPHIKGCFCLSTSYRNEPNAIEGRHCKIFPMFEFESHGGIGDLFQFEIELLDYLGFKKDFHSYSYKHFAQYYDMKELTSIEENAMESDFGPIVFINQFPEYTNPFWNMSRNSTGTANKIDVILHGQETIGSAERSCDKQQMRDTFFSIEDGKYSEKLFTTFGYHRVLEELNEFLKHDFIPRWGGGIGVTRLIRSMKLNNLM